MKTKKLLILCMIIAFMLTFNFFTCTTYAKDQTRDKNSEEEIEEDKEFIEYTENNQEMQSMSGDKSGDEEVGSQISNGIAESISNIGDYVLEKLIPNNTNNEKLTFDDIVFDNYPPISIDFYQKDIDPDSFNGMVKETVELWYIRFRSIAMTCYLIILLYIGIRILITVSGKKQEKYKEFLTAWGEGLVLLFFFPAVLKMTIQLNHNFVQLVRDNTESAIAYQREKSLERLNDPNNIRNKKFELLDATSTNVPNADSNFMRVAQQHGKASISSAIIWGIIAFQFVLVLITYFKRMFMMGFLIVIFPVVMILYPIDKVNDGKSQTFSVWLREVMANVFMQSFHALIYVFAMGVSANAPENWILAMIGVMFLFKGEEIIKAILGMGGSASIKSPREHMAKAAATIGVATKLAGKVTEVGSMFVSSIKSGQTARARGYRHRLFGGSKKKNEERSEQRFNAMQNLLTEEEQPTRRLAPSTSEPLADGANPDDTANGLVYGEMLPPAPPSPPDGGGGSEGGDGTTSTESPAGTPAGMGDATNTPAPRASSNRQRRRTPEEEEAFVRAADSLIMQLGYLDDEQMAKALEDAGLTTDGKQALRDIASARNQALKSIGKLDEQDLTQEEYEKEVQKIHKKFTVTIKKTFDLQVSTKTCSRQAYQLLKSSIKLHGGTRCYGRDSSGHLKVGRVKEYDRAAIKEQATKKLKSMQKIADKTKLHRERNASMDEAGMPTRHVFATYVEENAATVRTRSETGAVLIGRAEEVRSRVLSALSSTKFDDKQKGEIASAMAVLKTFGETTRLDNETLTDELRNGNLQLYTVEQVQKALDLINKNNRHGELDSLLKDGLGDSLSLGGTGEEVNMVFDDIIATFGLYEETTEAIADGEAAGEAATDTVDESAPQGAVQNEDDIIVDASGEVKEQTDDNKAKRDKIRDKTRKYVERAKFRDKQRRKGKTKFRHIGGSVVSVADDVADSTPGTETTPDGREYIMYSKTSITMMDVLDAQNRVFKREESARPVAPGTEDTVWEEELSSTTDAHYDERVRDLENKGADVLRSFERELEFMDAEKTEGMTLEQWQSSGAQARRESNRNRRRAIGTLSRTALAAMTTGPMAIGLNTGQSPIAEYVGGVFLGQKALEGGPFNPGSQTTIRIKDDFGVVRTISIDTYSLSALAPDILSSFDNTKIYDIRDLRYNPDPFSNRSSDTRLNEGAVNALLSQIEGKLAEFAPIETQKIEDEDKKRREAAEQARAKAKVSRFNGALPPRGRRS